MSFRNFIFAFAVMLAALPALGQATDSAHVSAGLQVFDTVSLDATWSSSGGAHLDFGAVSLGSSVSDDIILNVSHNLPPGQTFSVSTHVVKTVGPAWQADVVVLHGGDVLSWSQATFGTELGWPGFVGGTGTAFSEAYSASFYVGSSQEPGEYAFELIFTVTSL